MKILIRLVHGMLFEDTVVNKKFSRNLKMNKEFVEFVLMFMQQKMIH